MHSAISALPASVREKVVGGVLIGDTKNKQSKASIKGVPADQLKSF